MKVNTTRTLLGDVCITHSTNLSLKTRSHSRLDPSVMQLLGISNGDQQLKLKSVNGYLLPRNWYSQNRGFYRDCLVLFPAILLCVKISAILRDVRAFSWLARFPGLARLPRSRQNGIIFVLYVFPTDFVNQK